MKAVVIAALLATTGLAQAAQSVELKLAGADGPGKSIGTISIEQNKY
ncbi:MAG TPA: superoxide dismutase [Cu-Zn] SodC1, partial [Pseudomonas sp.]|nr:superoxide dismutase [Cu-Zn] SodC1 [Pseudomonas sp.]